MQRGKAEPTLFFPGRRGWWGVGVGGRWSVCEENHSSTKYNKLAFMCKYSIMGKFGRISSLIQTGPCQSQGQSSYRELITQFLEVGLGGGVRGKRCVHSVECVVPQLPQLCI